MSAYTTKAAEFIKDAIHGSGVDLDWVQEENGRSIRLINSFHCMDDHGGYVGWSDFTIILPKHSTDLCKDFILQFRKDRRMKYLAAKNMLRDYLEDTIAIAIDDCFAEPVELEVKEDGGVTGGFDNKGEFKHN